MEKLKPIVLVEGRYQDNLTIIKNFYNTVWGAYTDYVENDKLLYEIFKKEQKIATTKQKAIILNTFYSAGMLSIQVNNFVEIFANNINEKKITNIGIIEYNKEDKETKTLLGSMESKYLHWHNEVQNIANATPIYDSNVRKMLSNKYEYLGYAANALKKPETLFTAINEFIKKYLGENCQKTHEVEVGDWKHTISTYRLVDKFLWLSYKVIKDKNNIPDDIKGAYETFTKN